MLRSAHLVQFHTAVDGLFHFANLSSHQKYNGGNCRTTRQFPHYTTSPLHTAPSPSSHHLCHHVISLVDHIITGQLYHNAPPSHTITPHNHTPHHHSTSPLHITTPHHHSTSPLHITTPHHHSTSPLHITTPHHHSTSPLHITTPHHHSTSPLHNVHVP